MFNNINIFELLKKEGLLEKIKLYPSNETIDDPYKQSKVSNFLNPITVDGLVRQVSFGSVQWRHYGTIPQDSLEIMLEGNRWTNLLLIAEKIEVRGNFYKPFRNESGTKYIQRPEYVIAIITR